MLRQNRGGQAEIVSLVARFRDATDPAGRALLARARHLDPLGYRRLVADVTWKLAQMPLPRLQRCGNSEVRFLYDLAWDETIARGRFEGGGVALGPVRGDLRELQDGECFYCRKRLASSVEVDHFLPWARHPDDGIHNLVAAHGRCNNRKRDFFAAADHVAVWAERFHRPDLARALADIATARRWGADAARTLSVARAVYLRLPHDARLWHLDEEFVPPDRGLLTEALAVGSRPAAAAEDPAGFDPELPA